MPREWPGPAVGNGNVHGAHSHGIEHVHASKILGMCISRCSTCKHITARSKAADISAMQLLGHEAPLKVERRGPRSHLYRMSSVHVGTCAHVHGPAH